MLIRTSRRVEPFVSARPNPLHPLARRLAGCWLLNEGTGRTVHDASGYRHDGSFSGGPLWSSMPLGHALAFDGDDDWISMGDCLDLGTDDITLLALVKYTAASQPDSWGGNYIGAVAGKGFLDNSRGYGMLVNTSNEISWQVRDESGAFLVASEAALNDGLWHVAVGVCDRDSTTGVRLYIDGVKQGASADPTTLNGTDLSNSRSFSIGSRQGDASAWFWDFAGSVAAVYVWRRVLTESEIRDLQRDPFALFADGQTPVYLAIRTGTVVDVAGSIEAHSGACATAHRTGNVIGTTGGISSLHGNLSVSASQEVRQTALTARMPWLGEALFHGATHTAFQLGTVLTQGWFWVRRNGCTVVYHGADIAQVDTRNIVHVAEPETQELLLPVHLPHPPDSTHCYLVRRFNSCGRLEQTTDAAVMVRLGSDGELAKPAPNAVFGLKADQVEDARLRLVWFYCPVDQEVPPGQFKVYWDDATGRINFENPLAAIPYEGRRFYSCRTEALAAGRYRFVVRAESQDHIEGHSSNVLVCEVTTLAPAPATVLSCEAI